MTGGMFVPMNMTCGSDEQVMDIHGAIFPTKLVENTTQ